MGIFQTLLEFYQKHDKLTIALLSLLGGWLLNKFGPALYSFIIGLLSKLGKKFGGRLAYKNIQDKYLNWVVLQNQDLNLTGIIGPGQKPKLEQVFISLKVLEESSDKDVKDKIGQQGSTWRTIISRFWISIWQNVLQVLKVCTNYIMPLREKTSLALFQNRRLWKTRLVLERDGIENIFAFSILVITPSCLLQVVDNVNGLIAGFSTIAIAFSIVVGLYRLKANFNDKESWIFLLFFSGIPAMIITLIFINSIVIGGQSPFAMIIGAIVGFAIFGFIVAREKRYIVSKDDERTAEEVGLLLSSHDTIAILGKPGAGKSTYIQFVALTFAQEKAGERRFRKAGVVKKRFGIRKWYLPILMPLRKVSSFIAKTPSSTSKNIFFDAFRHEILPSEVRDIFSDAYLRNILKKKRGLFLLDGLDEVANDEEFRVVVNEIRGLVSQFPGNKFIVTSRHAGWRGGISSTFITTDVNDLNDNQITTFIDSWYQAIEENRARIVSQTETSEEKRFRRQKAKDRAEKLKHALRTVENIRNLAKNPLLLSMICFVHYNKTLPKERLSLYEDCSKLLLDQWDIEKGLPQDDIPLSFARKETIMQEIAFALHSGKIGTGLEQKETTSEEIIPIIGRVLERFDIDSSQAEILFQKLVSRTGLIVVTEKYKDLYGFSHLTFQEFYTAKYLHKNGIDIITVIQQSSPEYSKTSTSWSWWREVILLYSGLQKDISQIIQKLCKPETMDLLRRQLQIAAQCLSEAVEVPSVEIDEKIINQLIAIRSNGKCFPNTKSLPWQVKQYLARFTTSSDFYNNALSALTSDVKRVVDAQELARTLLQMVESDDGEVKLAALIALFELWETGSITQTLNKDTLASLLINATQIMQFSILQFIVFKFPNSLDEDFVKQVIDQTVEPMIKNFRKFQMRRISATQISCQILQMLVHNNFQSKHHYLQQLLADAVFRELNSQPAIFPIHRLFDLSFEAYLECFLKTLFKLDSNEQMKLHRQQLLEMLNKGTFDQQAWAIFLLERFFSSDSEVIDSIFKKLKAPSRKTRLAAISALRHLTLDEQHLNFAHKLLTKTLERKTVLNKLWLQLSETFAGKGALGIDQAERIQIAGTLFVLNNFSDDFMITKLLSKVKDDVFYEKYQWLSLLIDLKGRLSETNIEKLLSWSEKAALRGDGIESLAAIANSNIEYSTLLKDKITSILLDVSIKRPEVMQLLKQFKPRIKQDSKEHQMLLTTLTSENYTAADAGYDILLNNSLI